MAIKDKAAVIAGGRLVDEEHRRDSMLQDSFFCDRPDRLYQKAGILPARFT